MVACSLDRFCLKTKRKNDVFASNMCLRVAAVSPLGWVEPMGGGVISRENPNLSERINMCSPLCISQLGRMRYFENHANFASRIRHGGVLWAQMST